MTYYVTFMLYYNVSIWNIIVTQLIVARCITLKKNHGYNDIKPFSFAEILDNLFGNITITDADGVQLYVNKGVCETYGMTRSELIGTNIEEFVHKGYINDSSILEVRQSHKETMRYIKMEDGTGLYSITNPVFDESGNLEYIICLSHNEKLYEEFLSRISEERQRLDDAFLYMSQQSSEISYFTDSPLVKNLYSFAKQISSFDTTVIITGESGSGKDVLARYIHQNSNRSNRLFIPVNCSAIPTELFEMEFFGYVKGSFTGALDQGKAGLFETAADGTLFLDEIGELPLSMQSKLLRVLEDGEFMRVGSNIPQKTDVRIISATNRDLKEMVRNGSFREDLYYRLSVVSLTVPSLRERKCDIKHLALHFLSLYNKKYDRHMTFAPDTVEFLEEYYWPGNIRELKNIVESMAVSSRSDLISTHNSIFNFDTMLTNNDVGGNKDIYTENQDMRSETSAVSDHSTSSVSSLLKENENDLITETLKKYNGNIKRAASRLGISRQTLYRKIRSNNIDIDKLRRL